MFTYCGIPCKTHTITVATAIYINKTIWPVDSYLLAIRARTCEGLSLL